MPEATVARSQEHKTNFWRFLLVLGVALFIISAIFLVYKGVTSIYDYFFKTGTVTQASQNKVVSNADPGLASVAGQVQSNYNIVPLGDNGRAGNLNNSSVNNSTVIASQVPAGLHLCSYTASDGTPLYCDVSGGFMPFQPSQTQGKPSMPPIQKITAPVTVTVTRSSSVNVVQPAPASTSSAPASNALHLCPYTASDGTPLYCDSSGGFMPFQPSTAGN